MYCKKCGKEIADGTIFCPYCGASQQDSVYQRVEPENPSGWWAVLCFFFPVIGLILYLVWRDEKPKTARKCGIGALVSVILYVVFFILYAILFALTLASVA